MVAVQVHYNGAPPEVALGTVTTVNDARRPGNLLGRHIAARGSIGESGGPGREGDIRSLTSSPQSHTGIQEPRILGGLVVDAARQVGASASGHR